MQVTFVCGAMNFGPETPSRASLGGSETAALMLAKAVAARGHEVTMFCNLPAQGTPDYFPSGEKHADGLRYVDLKHYQNFITVNQVDVLVVLRDPGLIALPAQAKKKILWMHDIATKRVYQRAFDQMAFTFDEIWAVSEWHKEQIAETTGYPRDRIVALRNGIVKYDDILSFGTVSKQLIYASRPERGLENLVKEGGVMEHLPEYKLVVAMYEHFPEHMRDYYNYIFARMKALPNVEFVGGKPNHELRQMIADSEGYIYPTQFEETSCILARECIEQKTPFITTSVGALPETLGDCGVFFEDYLHWMGISEPERGSRGWCKLFADFLKDALARQDGLVDLHMKMAARDDLYWDGVAEMVEPRFAPQPTTHFSRLWSLLQDGDVVPARAYYSDIFATEGLSLNCLGIGKELALYDFIDGDMAAYYDKIYTEKAGTEHNELRFTTKSGGQRHDAIAEQIATLPPGSTVFEYGCGPGHIIGPLAATFPNIEFIGYDFSQAAVDVVNAGAKEYNLPNLSATADVESHMIWDDFGPLQFDAVICSEVLEHVTEPWELLAHVEECCKPDGLMIITVPFGAWEPQTYEHKGRWAERAHLWAIDRVMFNEMCGGEKPDLKTQMIVAAGATEWMRPVGNYMFTYKANHAPTVKIDALAKAMRHWSRETAAACIIAFNNEDTIVRLLNSLDKKVQFVKVALGPCTDQTRPLMEMWFEQHPWMRYEIIDVPQIKPYEFGFDDARNASFADVGKDCEWAWWIDTDEYLSGEPRKFYRPSCVDGYLVAQHHFTCEPRGNPPEIDKPARLIRTDRQYKAIGHIHEHFEVPEGGPGRCMLLPDVDIGHPGYVNEMTRRGRFFRNFPFLAWEHHEGGDRKLHKFLWLRDIIHRMRFTQDVNEKVKFAREAMEWYNANQADMSTFGPGMFMAIAYLSEAHTLLGIGVPVHITVRLEDRQAVIEGRFENYKQAENVLSQLLEAEFKERQSKYY